MRGSLSTASERRRHSATNGAMFCTVRRVTIFVKHDGDGEGWQKSNSWSRCRSRWGRLWKYLSVRISCVWRFASGTQPQENKSDAVPTYRSTSVKMGDGVGTSRQRQRVENEQNGAKKGAKSDPSPGQNPHFLWNDRATRGLNAAPARGKVRSERCQPLREKFTEGAGGRAHRTIKTFRAPPPSLLHHVPRERPIRNQIGGPQQRALLGRRGISPGEATERKRARGRAAESGSGGEQREALPILRSAPQMPVVSAGYRTGGHPSAPLGCSKRVQRDR